MKVVLTIAGSDSGGGAGLQADLKSFHRLGLFGTCAVTLVTAQNTVGVQAVHLLPEELVVAQLESVVSDLRPSAAKTGALGSAGTIRAVAKAARRLRIAPLVVDPVLISKHGAPLVAADALEVLRSELLPLAEVVTPNLREAEALLGRSISSEEEMADAAKALVALGPRSALVKGGDRLKGAGSEAVDLLYDGRTFHRFASERVALGSDHGSGCTLSAALTAFLALGEELPQAARLAKEWVTKALREAPGLGAGRGPLNHWA